jgi:hypothetical protein
LSAYDVRRATAAGERRCALALSKGVGDYHPGMSPARWRPHVLGALGECAFASAYGIPWDGDDAFGRVPDVGGCEIRTRAAPYLDLSFKANDHADRPYVLVQQVTRKEYDIVGWLTAAEGRQDRYYRRAATPAGTYYDVWFVPPSDLHPLDTLPVDVAAVAA